MTTVKEIEERLRLLEIEFAKMSGRMTERQRPISLFPSPAVMSARRKAAWTAFILAIAAAIAAVAKYYG